MLAAEPNSDLAVLTTPQLICDLQEIDDLVAILRRTQNIDAEDIEDLTWLRHRRRYILAVLASRRALHGQKIVSLDLWRNGSFTIGASANSRAA
jgi:hypothetical protein